MTHDLARLRDFFGARAAGWEAKFPDDGPAYTAAVEALDLFPGDRVFDAGCGTGRALPPLRAAVGPSGVVLGGDVTPEMLAEATRRGRQESGVLMLADVAVLPLGDGALDAVFAAGLIAHLPDPAGSLRELARVVRPGGRLALFHPVGRAALAARQGRRITEDDLRAEPRLRPLLASSGWRLETYVDDEDRFLALAVRADGLPSGTRHGKAERDTRAERDTQAQPATAPDGAGTNRDKRSSAGERGRAGASTSGLPTG